MVWTRSIDASSIRIRTMLGLGARADDGAATGDLWGAATADSVTTVGFGPALVGGTADRQITATTRRLRRAIAEVMAHPRKVLASTWLPH
jgi:hypothetical protein